MCGLFGVVGEDLGSSGVKSKLGTLARHARRRGRDSSGLVFYGAESYKIFRADFEISALWKRVDWKLAQVSSVIAGHSRLVTNGHNDNQPVFRDGITVLHNGIVLDPDVVWQKIRKRPSLEIDTEVIAAAVSSFLDSGHSFFEAATETMALCKGVINCVVIDSAGGHLAFLSNNGSLFTGSLDDRVYFASEKNALDRVGCDNISQVSGVETIRIPLGPRVPATSSFGRDRPNLVPKAPTLASGESELPSYRYDLRRCSKCVLPETMPYIHFDDAGVCNYCHNYKSKMNVAPVSQLLRLLEELPSQGGRKVIFPFSGGRDSSYGLHLAVQELGLRPVAYTYDWGMVTDLGRRNLSRMCSELGVEHIIVAADIERKRANIRKNVSAWLNNPTLGMVNLFTAGDKHFFQYLRHIQRETGIQLNLWSFNPLETTHFKAGFLGVPPAFGMDKVYATGLASQIAYQGLRAREFLRNPSYFNSSVFDTLSGEFYRSVLKPTSYHQIFDYFDWNEATVDEVLDSYDWERADDTTTTWRIGDGTAAFYNYIFYRVAGFSEHDTLRSNQIREGHLTRDKALDLLRDENMPRERSIHWYLEAIGLPFRQTMERIIDIPQLLPRS
jgi:glucosamine--fructose-6-phosphate aminotransferase (isomerizing)